MEASLQLARCYSSRHAHGTDGACRISGHTRAFDQDS